MKKTFFPLFGAGLMMAFSMAVSATPTTSYAATSIAQGVGPAILGSVDYFGGVDPSTPVTVDIVMRLQHENQLASYINRTVKSNSPFFHRYLTPDVFALSYGGDLGSVMGVQAYLEAFGIQTSVSDDNLIVTANGTAGQFNKAFNVSLEWGNYKGKKFHGSKKAPQLPNYLAKNVLCILGLTNYSNFTSHAMKQVQLPGDSPVGPLSLTPNDLVKQYHVQPLYDKGAAGAGQTIGIVTLAEFNPEDAYAFWKDQGLNVDSNRIQKIDVDGGSGWDGYDETTLDVEQSGALAPKANVNVYVGPNTDTGFIDAFSKAINDNSAQQISVSWGQSETMLKYAVSQNMETPEYMEAFNQLFMQAAAQGISMFAAAGDEGAYDAVREFGLGSGVSGAAALSVDTPADSPYITAAGGTTLPFHFHSNKYNTDIVNSSERAWGWDYLYPYFDLRGLNDPTNWADRYLAGGGGGFSQIFNTPAYQHGVPGINSYTAVSQWTPSSDVSTLTRNTTPTVVQGSGSGRNVPDLAMDADPYTGYEVYFSSPGQPGVNSAYATYGGTSFVAPQLCGLSALINSADGEQVGFWNPQIYRFAMSGDSPFHPLSTVGAKTDADGGNDNGFYTGTPNTVYNQSTGLGTPDISSLAKSFMEDNWFNN